MNETAKPQRTYALVPVVIALIFALIATVICGGLYKTLVQAPLCYTYAAEQGMVTDNLTFAEVEIVNNRAAVRRHTCRFTDAHTTAPVLLEFAPEDIPYTADTFQVLSMVLSFVCGGIVVWVSCLLIAWRLGISIIPPLYNKGD